MGRSCCRAQRRSSLRDKGGCICVGRKAKEARGRGIRWHPCGEEAALGHRGNGTGSIMAVGGKDKETKEQK